MAIERTFSIIKPDATARNLTGAVNALIEKAGLRIIAQKRIQMTKQQAETFYAVHKARPFFGELVEIIWINVLVSADNAVVIALACRNLPPRERRLGMVLGAGVAVVLRIVFAGVISALMALPYLKIVGALTLLWVAAKLLVPSPH